MDRFDSVNDTPNYQESNRLNHTFDTQIGNMYNVSKAIAQQDKHIDEIDTRKGYSKTETDDLLNTKANADDVYTKTETYNQTEINDLLNAKADADNVYTKTETDNLLNAKADADDVYTKTETDNLLDNKLNITDAFRIHNTYIADFNDTTIPSGVYLYKPESLNNIHNSVSSFAEWGSVMIWKFDNQITQFVLGNYGNTYRIATRTKYGSQNFETWYCK